MGDVQVDSSMTCLIRSPALSVTDFSALVSSAFQLNQDRLHLADSLALSPSFDFDTHSFRPKKRSTMTSSRKVLLKLKNLFSSAARSPLVSIPSLDSEIEIPVQPVSIIPPTLGWSVQLEPMGEIEEDPYIPYLPLASRYELQRHCAASSECSSDLCTSQLPALQSSSSSPSGSQHSHIESSWSPCPLTPDSPMNSIAPSSVAADSAPASDPDPFAKGHVQIVRRSNGHYAHSPPSSPTRSQFYRSLKAKSNSFSLPPPPSPPQELPSPPPSPTLGYNTADLVDTGPKGTIGFKSKRPTNLKKINTSLPKPTHRRKPSPFPLLIPKLKVNKEGVSPTIRGSPREDSSPWMDYSPPRSPAESTYDGYDGVTFPVSRFSTDTEDSVCERTYYEEEEDGQTYYTARDSLSST